AVVSAANNVNLSSGSGSFANAGLIAAQGGNVNFSTGQMAADMAVNNTGGTVQALLGQINVRDNVFNAKSNTNLTGGDWQSKELNINSGSGSTSVNVGQATGVVNVNTGTLSLNEQSGDLTLGTVQASGDPTITSTGSIFLGTETTNGGPLIVVAGANI